MCRGIAPVHQPRNIPGEGKREGRVRHGVRSLASCKLRVCQAQKLAVIVKKLLKYFNESPNLKIGLLS